MRPVEIEAWALRVIDAVEKKQPIEDTRVELKREWPKPEKAARQLAGHANAARGDDLLWLIGVDEQEGVIGAEFTELANWLPQVQREFESVSPEVASVNVNHRGVVVAGLHVKTDRIPFRVRVPGFGSQSGVSVQWETPWRDGNRTRTATREELVRMLFPKVEQPRFEILEARATADKAKKVITVQQKLYIVPPRDTLYVYPKHKAMCSLRLGDQAVQGRGTLSITSAPKVGESIRNLMAVTQRFSNQAPRVNVNAVPEAVEVTDTEVIVRAPGSILIHDTLSYSGEVILDQPLTIETYFESAHDLVTCHLTCFLERFTEAEATAEWHPRTLLSASPFTVLG